MSQLSKDPKWDRANTLFVESNPAADLALIGIPAHKTSLSATSANLTPDAIREALARYSTFSTSGKIALYKQSFTDLGNISDPDGDAGEARVADLGGAQGMRSHESGEVLHVHVPATRQIVNLVEPQRSIR